MSTFPAVPLAPKRSSKDSSSCARTLRNTGCVCVDRYIPGCAILFSVTTGAFGSLRRCRDTSFENRKEPAITPTIRGEILMYLQDEQKQKLTVGTAAWFSWLETASTFSFVSEEGRFTARQEQASQQRGGRYWKAYCKQHGKLSSRYLGKSETLTLERLRAVAVSLTNTPCTTAQHGYEAPPVSSPLLTDDLLNPLLATKLHPPRLRTPLVSRSHLVQRLQQGVAGPLTLLSAPPGYGKTTLLTQWQAESTTRVAWLSLEQQDNDPVCFLTYLLAALQRHCPDLDMNILALLQA